jgi:hypothetical protein
MDKTFFFTASRLALRTTHPPIQWVLGAHFPEVKWLGHEADKLPLSSAKVKELTSTPSYVFIIYSYIAFVNNENISMFIVWSSRL